MSRVLFRHHPIAARRRARRRANRTPGDHVVALILWCGIGLLVWLVALWGLWIALGWR